MKRLLALLSVLACASAPVATAQEQVLNLYSARHYQTDEALYQNFTKQTGIAGGVESMSRAPFVIGKAATAFSREAQIFDTTIGWRFVNPLLERQYGVDSMMETAENVAAEFAISRQDQDQFAAWSQAKAEAARATRTLAEEITPVTLPRRKQAPLVVDADEHPRPGTTVEELAKLPPLVRDGGTVTAGNASGVNDGACALLVASRAAAARNGLRPRARVVATATANAVSPGFASNYGQILAVYWSFAPSYAFLQLFVVVFVWMHAVAPGAFTPPPKVDSSVVPLVPHAKPPVAVNDETQFAKVVRAAFASRRKTLRNNMKGLLSAEDMTALGIDPTRRAETLTLAEFAALSNDIAPSPG